MGTHLEIQIDKMEISERGLDKLKFHYDTYNPIRGDSFIELPD